MLNISIVLYHPDWEGQVLPLVQELLRVRCLRTLYLVDNSPKRAEVVLPQDDKLQYVYNDGKNLGYGAGHNVALRESIYHGTEFHLVMNSDVVVKAEDIDKIHSFMEVNPEVGHLLPHVVYPDGSQQYLCRLLPTPLDVFSRRFLPNWMFRKRNARYELQASGYDKPMNVPYLSGCFMFLRTEAVKKVHLFDERFFLYPEDIDLSRRIHREYISLYYPDVTIVHSYGHGSYKSLHLLWIHIVNMCRYFNKYGWFFDTERRRVNQWTLEHLPK